MKVILMLIMMNGTVYNLGFTVDRYDTRTCDKLFDSITYKGKTSGKNKQGVFYKSKEVFAHSCSIEKTTKGNNERKNKTS
jgi:hypothetical protein